MDRIDIPDTVGYSTPKYISQLVTDVITATKLPVSVIVMTILGLRLQILLPDLKQEHHAPM